jgi:hypothetical protein
MADKKISALDAASTPLAGTEVVALVQSGTTKKVPVSDLTAGRALSATQLTLTTGNLIVANGQGIDFSATSGTGTSKLLDDYEEGTWTPTQGSGLTVVGAFSSSGTYTKIGRQVTVRALLTGATTIACSAGGVLTNGLPFASAGVFAGSAVNFNANSGSPVFLAGDLYATNAIAAASTIAITVTYFV